MGRWLWIDHQTLVFREDGKAEALKEGRRVREGCWIKANAPRRYSLQWASAGGKEEVEVSADGWSLQGVSADGVSQRGERLDDGEGAEGK